MNPSQDPYRQRLIRIGIIAGVIFIALGLTAFFIGRNARNSTRVDPDTGETIYADNNTRETEAGGGELILLGSTVLTDNGATYDQVTKIKALLQEYGSKNLHNEYDRLALVPDTFVNKNGTLTGKMRLGIKETRVDVAIKLIELIKVQIIIKDPTGKYRNYDSGVQDARSSEEQLDGETETDGDHEHDFDSGDGVPPEQQPPFTVP